LENDNLEDKLDNEIRTFKDIISRYNYRILKGMRGETKGLTNFFKQHAKNLPYLEKLTYIMLCMNSSSSWSNDFSAFLFF
jgi:hypothetical protein